MSTSKSALSFGSARSPYASTVTDHSAPYRNSVRKGNGGHGPNCRLVVFGGGRDGIDVFSRLRLSGASGTTSGEDDSIILKTIRASERNLCPNILV